MLIAFEYPNLASGGATYKQSEGRSSGACDEYCDHSYKHRAINIGAINIGLLRSRSEAIDNNRL
jgi:hypothetical protein